MRIGIDMGHTVSGPNSGANGHMSESEETRRLGNLVISYLRGLGETVINCSVDHAGTNADSLEGRVKIANESNLDIFVSLHFNSGGGYGTEIYTYNGKRLPEAEMILKNMKELGFRDRGIKNGNHLYVIRKTYATAMLVEVAFIDSKDDMNRYNQHIDRVAMAIAEGIIREPLNNPNPPGTTNPPTKPPTKPTYTKKEAVMLLQRGINAQGYANPPLVVDGIFGERTLNAAPTVYPGSKGEITRAIQEMLIVKGMDIGSYGADGIFGRDTEAAVKRLQRHYNLKEDGIVGKNTYKALFMR